MKAQDSAEEGRRRAWAWVAHLRYGGTTEWQRWREGGVDRSGVAGGPALPGAQQLELLRRLNVVGSPSSLLVERVLQASAAGRGSPDLELVGAAADSAFGPRPVDPSRLPPAELLRVATALLAEELVAVVLPEPVTSRRLAWRRGVRVLGDPAIAGPAQERMIRTHRRPTRSAAVVVAGAPLAQMLSDVWVERCFADGGPRWEAWLAGLEQHRRLPPKVDLSRLAEIWAARAVGVTVVLDPPAGARPLGVAPIRPSADAAELARRIAPLLALMATPDRRKRLLGQALRPRLLELDREAVPPGVPEVRSDWVARRARRMAESLVEDDYPVVGDPRRVLPAEVPGATPTGAGALDLAIRVLGEGLDRRGEGR